MKYITPLLKKVTYLLVVFIAAWMAIPQPVALAQVSEDSRSIYSETTFYDDTSANNCSVGSATASSSSVYIIGDSYSKGVREDLTKKLTSAGYNISGYNAHGGRGVNAPGADDYPAIKALTDDEEAIKDAGTVIILLGTNPEDYNKTIPLFMKKLNSINATARKFWVNVGVTKPSLVDNMTKTNKALDKYAEEFKYTVINWAALVEKTPSLMSADKYHPDAAGYTKLAELIMKSVGEQSQQITLTPPIADPNKDNGKKNEPYVWAYFIGKGLTPVQVAGLMGNMKAEAHFEPRLVEYGWLNSRGETSQAGEPSSFDEEVPPNQNSKGQPGYGIVQWTSPGRKDGLRDLAKKTGKKPSDLSLQLDNVWRELNGGYSDALKQLKAATTAEEAALVIMKKYEIPGDQAKQGPIRVGYAEEFLKKYANFSGSVSGCTSSAGQAGVGGWDLEGPNAMTYYAQTDKKWSGQPYGSCSGDTTIGSSGCGITSMAMIVSTLTPTKITPPEMAKYSVENGYRVCGVGTGHGLAAAIAKKYNLKSKLIGTDFAQAAEALNKGGLVWVSVGAGTFTSGGHLMVIRKVTPDGKKFYIADPASETGKATDASNNKAYTIAELTGEGNVQTMYAITK